MSLQSVTCHHARPTDAPRARSVISLWHAACRPFRNFCWKQFIIGSSDVPFQPSP